MFRDSKESFKMPSIYPIPTEVFFSKFIRLFNIKDKSLFEISNPSGS